MRRLSDSELIAVVAEIAHCTLTNYSNRLAGTDLDAFLEAWSAPSARPANDG